MLSWKYSFVILWFLLSLFLTSTGNEEQSNDHDEPYNEESSTVSNSYSGILRELENKYGNMVLPRLKPVKVGHQVEIEEINGKKKIMKTLSKYPPIFEIKDFLSNEECASLIEQATTAGLQVSRTLSEDEEADVQALREKQVISFKNWDTNNDGVIQMNEAQHIFDNTLDFLIDEQSTAEMLQHLKMDLNHDGIISASEFSEFNFDEMALPLVRYVNRIKLERPETKSRHSEQTFLNPETNPLISELQMRLATLTDLPLELIEASEDTQVVRYDSAGHYNCHLDSEEIFPDNPKCCHIEHSEGCSLCRYMTVLYFLNDVEVGGETAFPLADNKTMNRNVWYRDSDGLCNLASNCHKSNVFVSPEKGKAILWYNHKVSKKDGWLGQTDMRSFHGGCQVIKGHKWIANNWINVSPIRSRDIVNWAVKESRKEDEASKSRMPEQDTDADVDTELIDGEENGFQDQRPPSVSSNDRDEL